MRLMPAFSKAREAPLHLWTLEPACDCCDRSQAGIVLNRTRRTPSDASRRALSDDGYEVAGDGVCIESGASVTIALVRNGYAVALTVWPVAETVPSLDCSRPPCSITP
jgi:hypothetical protein